MKSYSYTKVSGEKYSQLRKQFSFIADLVGDKFRITADCVAFDDSRLQFDYRFVSVFDHQLNHEEADQLLGNTTKEQNFIWNRSHEKHIRSLYGHSYLSRLKGRRNEKLDFLTPSTERKFLEMANDLIFYPMGEHVERHVLIMPEFSVVYYPCYDYTNLALILDTDRSAGFFDNLVDYDLHSYKINN